MTYREFKQRKAAKDANPTKLGESAPPHLNGQRTLEQMASGSGRRGTDARVGQRQQQRSAHEYAEEHEDEDGDVEMGGQQQQGAEYYELDGEDEVLTEDDSGAVHPVQTNGHDYAYGQSQSQSHGDVYVSVPTPSRLPPASAPEPTSSRMRGPLPRHGHVYDAVRDRFDS